MWQPEHRDVIWLLKGVFLLVGIVLVPPAAAQSNPIVIENQQPGTSQWRIPFGSAATDGVGQIKGYASATSVNKGQNITFYVSTNPAQTYTIDVYRMGWYQGLGGRLMQHIGPLNGVQQPTCPTDVTTGMIECQWAPAYTLNTQTSWTSGIYLALLTNAQGYLNYIVFVVRDDSRVAALLYQQPVATYQAYNDYPYDSKTGKSLYTFNSYGATTVSGGQNAVKVSFDRPYLGDGTGIDWGQSFFSWEFAFVRWMEQSGYDVTYATDVDTHTNGSMLLNYRGVLSGGHDEYWSKAMYDAFVSARDAGVNLGFLGADAIFWQVRFEPSSSGVPNRVVVCYKDASIDPVTDPSLKTVNWRDPLLNRPEQTLIGVQDNSVTLFMSQNNGYYPYVVTNSGNWVYAGTGFKDGDSLPHMVGYETDRLFKEYPPPNAVSGTYTLLSHSPIMSATNPPTSDYSNSSIYQAPSGAWVFATGTFGWSYGLDNFAGYNVVDPRIQQTTANVLNRFSSPVTAPDSVSTGDFDGDGKTDIAVFRPSSGTWFIIPSSNPSSPIVQQWGTQGDIPVPGDYDGDGKTDIAVFRPSSGTWFIIPSSTPGSPLIQQWGTPGDIPVPGDYDGDGKTDIAVFRPSNPDGTPSGTWFIIPSSTPGSPLIQQWGTLGDIPVPADYDGDGKTDVAVFRPSNPDSTPNGTWFIIPSNNPGSPLIQQWGTPGDIPIPKDYDGNRKADIAVWRPSSGTWFIIRSTNPSTLTMTQWGTSTDTPVR